MIEYLQMIHSNGLENQDWVWIPNRSRNKKKMKKNKKNNLSKIYKIMLEKREY